MVESRGVAVAVAFVVGTAACAPPAPTGDHLGICVRVQTMQGPAWRASDRACSEGVPPHGSTAVLWLPVSDPRPVSAVGDPVDVTSGSFVHPVEDGRRRFGAPVEGSPTVADAWKAARRG